MGVVEEIIIGVVQQMQDDERRPVILETRKEWGCDDLRIEDVRPIIERLRSRAIAGLPIDLGPSEARTLFAYMLASETQTQLDRMGQRRMSG
jgi:hypothetical protein